MSIHFAPDLILHNGKIVTVDKGFSVHEALAVYGKRFVAIGKSQDVKDLAGPQTHVVNLEGKCVVPGQMDNHVHMILAGFDAIGSKAKVDIARDDSIEKVLATIAKRVATTPKGKWIGTSCMYRGALKEGRFPTRHDLDKVAPDHPVYIFQSGKNVIANSYALKLSGITADTAQPSEPEGWIVKDDDGQPTGHLIAGAADMARKAWWKHEGLPIRKWDFLQFDQETQLAAIAAQQKIYHSCGIVAIRDMGVSIDELDAYIEAHRRGLLKVRSDVMLGLPARYLSQDDIGVAIDKYFGPKQHLGDDMLKIAGIKLVVVNDGWWAYSKEKVKFLIEKYNRHGWNMAIHVNTGGAGESTEVVLSNLEAADKELPIAGRRFTFEHGCGLGDPDHIRRMQKLGIIVASNTLLSYYASARSLRMNEIMSQVRIAKTVEKDAWKRTVRDWGLYIRDWIDAGIVVTGGSDNSAVVHDPEHPFLGQYSALTGNTLAGVLLPGQNATREEMLRMYTINGAYSSWREDTTGSIEVGKFADMVVLDTDILTCSDDGVRDLRVLQTYVGGELVYERGA